MSLLVWLPLTKNLNNLGLSNVTITNTNATLSTTEGKLGGSYYFNGSARIQIAKPAELTTLKNTTICAWVKSTSSTCALGGISHDKGNTESTGCCTLFGNSWQFTNNSAWKYYAGGTVANQSVWKHVAITIGDDTARTYLNGEQVTTFSLTTEGIYTTLNANNFIEIGSDFPGGNEYLTGYVNDFRVYNECLSKKQIKEISQGLCCHYMLKGDGSNANLLKTSPDEVVSGELTTNNAIVTDSILSRKVYEKATTATTESYIYSTRTGQVEQNTNYTFSAMVYVNEYVKSVDFYWLSDTADNKKAGGNFVNITYKTGVAPTPNKWQKMTWTFTTKSNDYSGYIRVDNNGSKEEGKSAVLRVCQLKLEKGDKATPWLPNSADTLYSKLGYGNTTEFDCSGNQNNATKVGTPTTYSSSPRYLTSAYFDGNTAGYTFTNNTLAKIIDQQYTMSFWLYSDGETGSRSIYFGSDGNTSYTLNIEKTTSNLLRYYWVGNPDATITEFTIPDGEWIHVAIVRESSTNTRFYKNGTLIYTLTTECSAHTTAATQFYLGRDQRTGITCLKGAMSDFRLYSTVLTAEEIKALYNNPIGIDKQGGLHCMEVIEE